MHSLHFIFSILIIVVVMNTGTMRLLGQELYPNTEAASNSPKDVLRLRFATMLMPTSGDAVFSAKGFYAVSDKLMFASSIQAGVLLSNGFPTPFEVYEPRFRSMSVSAKYRLYSDDKPHQHIRFAAFAEYDFAPSGVTFASYLGGIKNGASAGAIGTVLLNKTALSASTSYFLPVNIASTQGLDAGVFNYSLSLGHLLLPERYTDYGETNLNLYCEVLGYLYTPSAARYHHVDAQHPAYNQTHYFHRIDIAPAVQLIFNSQAKLDFSIRTQILDEYYTARHWIAMLAFEWYFF